MDKSKILNLKRLLTEQKTMPELFQSIPASVSEWASTTLLAVLTAWLFISAFWWNDGDWAAQSGVYTRLMLGIGYLGLLTGAFWLIWEHYNEPKPWRERSKGNGLVLCLGAMLVWSCISCALSNNVEVSFFGDFYRIDGLMSYLAYAGIFILATRVRSKKAVKVILNTISAVAAITALTVLLNIPQVNNILGIERIRAFFQNQNHYGYFLCMALPTTIWLYIDANTHKKGLYIVEAGLISNSLIICKTLGTLLAAVLGLVLLIVFVSIRCPKERKSASLIITVIAAVLVVSSLGYWNVFGDVDRTVADVKTINENVLGTADTEQQANLDSVGSGRGIVWRNTLQLIKEKPLFGYGPDNLGAALMDHGCKLDRPHCEPMQFAAMLGIPGALFYIAGMIFLLAAFIRNFKRLTAWEICGYVVVGTYLMSSMVGNTMYYTTPTFFTLLGLCHSQIRELELKACGS